LTKYVTHGYGYHGDHQVVIKNRGLSSWLNLSIFRLVKFSKTLVQATLMLYSQGGGKKNVVYPLDTYQQVKNTYFDRIDTRIAGKLRVLPPLHYTVGYE
jgi:hypothetical protein